MEWVKMGENETLNFVINANNSLKPFPFEHDSVVERRELSFYRDVWLVRVSKYSKIRTELNYIYGLYADSKFLKLDGTNKAIYEVNNKKFGPFRVNAENFDDYIDFFFSYVEGRHGYFDIVKNYDDMPISDVSDNLPMKYYGEKLDKEKVNTGDLDIIDKELNVELPWDAFESNDHFYLIQKDKAFIFDKNWKYRSNEEIGNGLENLKIIMSEELNEVTTSSNNLLGVRYVVFKDTLFKTLVSVDVAGNTDMEEQLIMVSLPVTDESREKRRIRKWR